MKKILLLACMISGAGCLNAQTINLKKGQAIQSQMSTNSDMEMMMGNMKNETSMKSKMTVIEESAEGYVIIRNIESMKMNADGMGQNMQFDSEKADDRKTEVGEMLSKQLNHIDTFSLNRQTGMVKSLNKVKSEMGGMAMMTASGDDEVQGAADAFLIVPPGIKSGSNWADSMAIKGLKTTRNFKVSSIANNIAEVEVISTVKGTTESEVQGMTMNMTIYSTTRGNMKVDLSTGLVLNYKNVNDVNTEMDMMGQNMQMTTKGNSTITNTVL